MAIKSLAISMKITIRILFLAVFAFSSCKMQNSLLVASLEPKVKYEHMVNINSGNAQASKEIYASAIVIKEPSEKELLPTKTVTKTKLRTSQKIELAIAKHVLNSRLKKRLESLEAHSKSDDPPVGLGGQVILIGGLLLIISIALLLGLLVWLVARIFGGISFDKAIWIGLGIGLVALLIILRYSD